MVNSSYTFIGSHNPKTILTMAALLATMGFFAKSWITNLPEPVSTELTEATVVSLEKKSMNSSGKYGNTSNTQYMFAELEIENGKTFRTFVPRPYPQVGEQLPVKITKYNDGTEQVAAVSEL